MIEMKVWVTPEVEVQNFQANEYVSACYTSQGASGGDQKPWYKDLIQLFFTGSYGDKTAYFYYDADDTKHENPIMITGSKVSGDPITVDSNFNSGTLFGEVYKGSSTKDWYGNITWKVEKNPVSGMSLFAPAQGDTIYAGTFTPVDERHRGVAWS